MPTRTTISTVGVTLLVIVSVIPGAVALTGQTPAAETSSTATQAIDPGTVNATVGDDPDAVGVTLRDDPVTAGLTARGGDVGSAEVVSHGGKQGWSTDRANGTKYIYVNVSDEFLYDAQPTSTVEIAVEYWDNGSGSFDVQYDGFDWVALKAGSATLSGDSEWKTATFEVTDALFANRLNDGDFRVSVNAYSNDVAVRNVTVRRVLPALQVEQRTLGNVFETDESPGVDVVSRGDTVTWAAYDYWGDEVASGEVPVEGENASVDLPVEEPGYYRLELTAETNGSVIGQTTTTFGIVSPFNVSQVEDSKFGVSAHFGQEANYGSTYQLGLIDLIRTAGAKNVRDELYWHRVEPEKGNYSFPEAYDTYMQALNESDLHEFIIFSYVNDHYDNGSTVYTDEGREGYAEYGEALLDRYPTIEEVEVYNEYNIFFGDVGDGPADSKPSYYSKMLNETYDTVQTNHSETTVVGGVTAGIDLPWLESVFQRGGLDHMDVVSVHPYRPDPETIDEDLRKLDALIREYNGGQDKPVWITELGWTTFDGGTSERAQAQNVVRAHVLAFSEGVEKYFKYEMVDNALDPTNPEHHFGLVHNPGSEFGKYTPKPSFAAYATMTRQLTGASYVSDDGLAAPIESHRFDRDGETVRVLWSSGEPTEVTVATDDPLAVTDVVGGTTTYHPHDGNVTLTLTADPVYVPGDVSVSAGADVAIEVPNAVLGREIPLELTVDNTDGADATDATFTVRGENYTVSAPAGETATRTITLPAIDELREGSVTATVTVDGDRIARLAESFTVERPRIVTLDRYTTGENRRVTVTIENNLLSDLQLEGIELRTGDGTVTQPMGTTVGAESTVETAVRLPGEVPPFSTVDVEATATFAGADPLETEGLVTTSWNPVLPRSPTIDGRIDAPVAAGPAVRPGELPEANVKQFGPAGNITDAADLGGEIRFTADDEHLYLTARIRDDVHAQPFPANQMWRGDSIQFALATERSTDATWYEYNLGLQDGNATLFRFNGPAGVSTGEVTNAEMSINRTGNYTVYELALPWSELRPLGPDNETVYASVAVDDNDGEGRKGWIEWGGDYAGVNKHPEEFHPVQLLIEEPPTVAANGSAPTDTDGDGRFEDVDGSGSFDVFDVAHFLDAFDGSEARTAVPFFDFDGDGRLSIFDVAHLLREL